MPLATMGAIDTLTTDPRGVLTGNDDVMRVRAVQKASCANPSHPPGTGCARLEAKKSAAATTATAKISSHRRALTRFPPLPLDGPVTRGECGDSSSPHPSYLRTSARLLKHSDGSACSKGQRHDDGAESDKSRNAPFHCHQPLMVASGFMCPPSSPAAAKLVTIENRPGGCTTRSGPLPSAQVQKGPSTRPKL